MTFPEQIGDKGQRYEIRSKGYPVYDKTYPVAWSNDLDGAYKIAAAFRLAPGCLSTMIFDREENKIVMTNYAGLLR